MASKVKANPMKPALAARIKNAQGLGGGVRQGKGGAKFVTGGKVGGGLAQRGTTAKKAPGTKRGTSKLNKAPTKAQPKSPKGLTNNLVLHNKVTTADVARLRKASNLATPAMGGGKFKSFIGGK